MLQALGVRREARLRSAPQANRYRPCRPRPARWPGALPRPADTAAPTQAEVKAPVGSHEFAPALGSQLSVMVRDGIDHAQLKLNPAEMGPIEVRISLDGTQAQVDFSAAHAATRQALQDAVPALASALRENGLTLTGGGVFEQAREQRGDARQDGTAPAGRRQPHAAGRRRGAAARPRARRARAASSTSTPERARPGAAARQPGLGRFSRNATAAVAFNNRTHTNPARRLGRVRGTPTLEVLMSTAAAVEGAVPVKAGKKKLIIILVAVLLLLAAAGGGVVFWLKAKAHAAQEAEDADDDGAEAAHATAAPPSATRRPCRCSCRWTTSPSTWPTAKPSAMRRSASRWSSSDAKAGEKIKVFMPAIRNNILMVLAHKRSSDLLERAGKEKLAEEVLRETERALGLEPAVPGARQEGRPRRRAAAGARGALLQLHHPVMRLACGDHRRHRTMNQQILSQNEVDALLQGITGESQALEQEEAPDRRRRAPTTWPTRSASSAAACRRWRSSTSASRATSASACST